MNKIINNFSWTGNKFMPKLYLKRPGFTYSACGPFTKHCEKIQKFRETGYVKHLYRNELGKACFAHDAACSDSKDNTYEIAGNRNYDGYQRALASMVNKFFHKKTGSGVSVNEQVTEELNKPIIKKFERIKVYGRFKDNIWAADLAEIESFPQRK